MKNHKLTIIPKGISGAAIYPYSDAFFEMGAHEDRYGEPYQLFRVVGSGTSKRIWVPRRMAPACDADLMSDGISVKFKSLFVPRNSEQERVIAESVQLLAQGENFLVEAPTGFGKTAVAMDIIAKLGKKVVIVVTKEDLRDQWYQAAVKFLGLKPSEIGFIQGDTFQVSGKKLVIAMIQSLAKEERYPAHAFTEFGLAIWDECHRVAADFFSQSCYRIPARLRMGLSATPDRKDGKEIVLRSHIGYVMVRTMAAPMTPRVIARKSPWVIPMTKIAGKDGKSRVGPIPHSPGKCGHVINMLCNHHPRNAMLASFIHAAYKKDRITLFQSDRKEHLETMAMMIQKLGIPPSAMAYYIGGMNEAEREHAKTKKVILATYQATAEGTDIPWADTLVMGTPKSDVRQIVGRVIRVHEGKQEPVVFDIVDDTSNVFAGYWNSRRQWYDSVGAVVSTVRQS